MRRANLQQSSGRFDRLLTRFTIPGARDLDRYDLNRHDLDSHDHDRTASLRLVSIGHGPIP